ncbi:TPA: hypothetical protein ACKQGZ_004709 [Serratia marcescens]|nr:hypothetical protein [Serratia marcescens]
MSRNNQQDFLEYLNEASKTVSDWPAWKQSGSDATQFQETKKPNNQYDREKACYALKRTVAP